MTQHTPGPWTQDSWEWWYVKAPTFVGVLTTIHIERNGKDVAKANARLIAAAPELLGACRVTLTELLSNAPHEKSVSRDSLEAAIAKAEAC